MKAKIGLEIHVQLNTSSKLFCTCRTDYGQAEPNTNICPICAGQPGGKPMPPDAKAISDALTIAGFLNAKPDIGAPVFVQRKHYFYPDLPSGYQRTSRPLAKDGKFAGIGIWEVHFEEDPGRYELKKGFVDYNRSGIPLAEIVTAPDMQSPQDARDFLGKLEHCLRYYDVIKDEVGSMRVDSNVSVDGGSRVEVKNINSFANVFDALSFEIRRQTTLMEQGMPVVQETRHFDENSGVTIRLRKKETMEEYRYVPDPDIPPLIVTKEQWAAAQKKVAEPPDARAARMEKQYKITAADASVLVIEREFADAYEAIAAKFDAQKLASWMRGPVRRKLNLKGALFRTSGLDAKRLEGLYGMFSAGQVTDNAADKILMGMLDDKNASAMDAAKSLGVLKSSDAGALRKACEDAVKENEKAASDYKAGNAKSLFFLVGKVMQKTKGTADATEITKTLKELMG